MKDYVNSAALQEYTTKLVAKLKTLFPGTPTAAATVADMTDHSKTYVYVGSETGYTAGDWYYWDGSAWTSGGPFQATSIITDTTLAVAGEAADAKATGDAIAAAKTAVLNAMAPAYSTSATYAVGDYVNYNGSIYRCTTAITTAESWTSGHWTAVTLGTDLEGQVSDLKTQLSEISDAIVDGTELSIPISWSQGNINTVTGLDETGTRQRTDYIELQQSSFVVTWEFPITDCIIYWYDENKVFKRHSGWQTKGTEITKANKYFRIVARKNGPNQLTDNEIKSFKVLVEPIWESEIQNLNTKVDSLEAVNSAFSVDDSILIHDGYFINSNGNLQSYTTSATTHYYATDYVDLSFCEQVKVQTCLGSGSTIAVYNVAKQLTRVITTKGSTAVFDYDITFDSNERYIRASFQEYTNFTTKDQFKLVAYKNVLLALGSISKGGGESNNAVERVQLKPLSAPTVVFIDDDGTDSLWDTTVPIFEEAGMPLTIAVGKDSAIMSDLETLRTWLSSADHDMVQHSLGSDQDLSAKTYAELISWIESEQAFFYNNGFVVTNLVYGGANWSEQMIRVVEKYYNCGCTIPNWQLGISYGYNLPGTSRYKLARYAVSNWTSTSGHSLQDCKDIFDEFLATGQNGLIIFYSHSYQLVDNPDRVQILTDFIDYVKAAQTRGDCTISTLSAVFG